MFVSPWDQEVIIPSTDGSEVVPVVIADQGDPTLLKNELALKSITEDVLKRILPPRNSQPVSGWQQHSLTRVSRRYGLGSKDLDLAIRAWGKITDNPYEQGLVALYERQYHKATILFQDSLTRREAKVLQERAPDVDFYLGESLYGEGRYRESAAAYERLADVKEGDKGDNIALAINLNADEATVATILKSVYARELKAS